MRTPVLSVILSCLLPGSATLALNVDMFQDCESGSPGDNPAAETQTHYDNILIDDTDPPFPLLLDIGSTHPSAPTGVLVSTGEDMQ